MLVLGMLEILLSYNKQIVVFVKMAVNVRVYTLNNLAFDMRRYILTDSVCPCQTTTIWRVRRRKVSGKESDPYGELSPRR